MTISLDKVFEVNLSESSALASIGSVAAATIGRAVSQFLIGWIPGLENAINAATAATLTEYMGWLLADQFSRQNTTICEKIDYIDNVQNTRRKNL